MRNAWLPPHGYRACGRRTRPGALQISGALATPICRADQPFGSVAADDRVRRAFRWCRLLAVICSLGIALSCQRPQGDSEPIPQQVAMVVSNADHMEQRPATLGVDQLVFDPEEVNGDPLGGLRNLYYEMEYRLVDSRGEPVVRQGVPIGEITHILARTPANLKARLHTWFYPPGYPADGWFPDVLGLGVPVGTPPWTDAHAYEAQRTWYVLSDPDKDGLVDKVPMWTTRFKVRWEPGWTRAQVEHDDNTYVKTVDPPTMEAPPGTEFSCDSMSATNHPDCIKG